MSSMYGQRGATGGMAGNKIPKGYQMGQIEHFTPEQWDVFRQFASLLGPEGFLSKIAGGDESAFSQMEAPALRQFSGIQGNIASRFSGGAGGQGQEQISSRRSSGFQNTMNQAASDFTQQLQSNRLGLQKEAINQLGNLSSNFLSQRPYERFLTEKQPSFLQQILGLFSPEGILGGQNLADYGKFAKLFI